MSHRFTFRARHRLSGSRQFQAVFAAKLTKPIGPLLLHARVADCSEHRLGLSIGRRFGPAHARNALKRRLREAFRQIRSELPSPSAGGAYDFVITTRPHAVLKTDEYRALLEQGAKALHHTVTRRAQRHADHADK